MDSPTEISPSTQLLLDEIRKLFDKFDARWAKQDAVREASRGVPVPTQSAAVGADVVADNWGGLFDGGDDSDEQHYEAPIVADNWGGLFKQPAHILEERDLESTDQIRIESCLTSTDPFVPAPNAAFDSEFSSTDGEAASTDEPNPGPAAVQATFEAAESPSRLAATVDDIIDFDRLSLLPDVLLGNIVSRLPIKDAAHMAVLSRRWRPLWRHAPFMLVDPHLRSDGADEIPNYYLLSKHAQILDHLFELGARRVLEQGVGPIGCVPAELALRSPVGTYDVELQRATEMYNPQLMALLADLNAQHDDCEPVFVGVDMQQLAGARACLDCLDNLTTTLLGANFDPAATPTQIREWRAKLSVPSPASSLLQLVVPEEDDEVPSMLPNRCSMNGLILIQRCFSLPSCYRWDAVLHRQHRPWPPPTELRLVSCDAGLRPLPWPLFNMVERNSVTCHFGRLWKPPWYVPIQQTVRCVLADLVEYWKHWSSYVHRDEMMWTSFTWEGCSDFSLPHITTRYAAAHVHILSAFVSLLASPKWCDQSKLLVLTVSKLSSKLTAPVFAPAAVQALRIRCSLLARIPRNDSLMQLKRGGITQWKLCHLLLSGPRVLIFAEDSSRHASCGSIRLHDTGSFERKAQIHISCSTVCLASSWCFAQCVHVAFLPVKWSAQLLVLGGMKCLYISLHAQQEQAISVPIWRMLTALDNCNIHSLSLSWECFSEVKEAVGIHWWKREGVLHGDGIRVCVTFQGILTSGFTEDKKTIQYITIHTPQLLKSEAEASWLICIKSQKLLWGPGDKTLCFGDSESHDYSSDMKVMLATRYFVKKIWRLDSGNITEDANALRTFSLYGTYGGLKTVFGKIKAHCKQMHSGAYAVPALCQKTIVMHRLVIANLLEASATSALGYSVHAKSESIELDLQVPWDPGDLYLHLQTLVHWLEGKPILKEEGMSVHCQVGPGCQDSCSNDTKGDRSAGGGHQRLFRKTRTGLLPPELLPPLLFIFL